MSEVFDPYYRWLGIPPKDQPPDHYRLLSVERFESHADVIAEAADRQMAHLRTRQGGQHAQHAARLLNEIAAARVCLLSPLKKAAYDAKLAQSPGTPGTASPRWPLIAAAVFFLLIAGWLLSTVWSTRIAAPSPEDPANRTEDVDSSATSSEMNPSDSGNRSEIHSNPPGNISDSENSGNPPSSESASTQQVPMGVWRPLESGQGHVKPLPADNSFAQESPNTAHTSITPSSSKTPPSESADPSASNSESPLPSANSGDSPSAEPEAVSSQLAPGSESLRAGEEVARYAVGKYPLASFAISADGQRIVVCNSENQLSVIDLKERKEIQTLSGADLEIEHLALVPDGRFFMGSGLTADEDLAQLRTYRVGDGTELTTLASANGPVTALAISPNGLQFASGHRLGVVSLNSTQTTVPPVVLFTRDRTAEITTLAFSNDNQQLVFGDRSGGVHIALISARRPNVQQHLDAHASSIQALSISSRSDLLLSAAADGSVSLWENWRGRDAAKAKLKFSTGKLQPGCAALSPAADLIATANESGEITLWDATTGKPTATLAGHTAAIIGLSFLPEGKRLASASRDGTIRVWDCAAK